MNILKQLAIILIISGALWVALFNYMQLPIVGYSYDGECVYIEDRHGRVACPDVLPDRYTTEYALGGAE